METTGLNRSKVLVVGRSTVNCVVVSRIVERMGLRPSRETPEQGCAALATDQPSIVILDGGPDNCDCDGMIDALSALRAKGNAVLPAVILLSTTNAWDRNIPIARVVDMIVAKPITVDRLQPAVESLRARNGDYSIRRQ